MSNIGPLRFLSLPPVIKNLIIINALFFLATIALEKQGIGITHFLGLHYPLSPLFRPHQLVSYMFMHGSFMHLFFNMFALWMFGNVLEKVWGPKRFLIFYMVTGLGAAVIQFLVYYIQLTYFIPEPSSETWSIIMNEGVEVAKQGMNYKDPYYGKLNGLINGAIVGASGSVFGVLLAYGMTFPNSMIYVYFAFPIKAKYFVMIYGAIELFSGVANRPGDNVAHFAHLGGMLFGYFLIRYWNKNRNTF